MSRLGILRSRLQSLGLARAAVRWGNALSIGVAVLLLSWLAAYLFDWSLQGNRWIRAAVLVAWGTGMAAVVHRWLWPLVGPTESLDELALVVEREHGIDSDLVAALQFDNPLTPVPGSTRLSSAVVDYVAEFSQTLDVFRGFSWEGLPRRAGVAGGLIVLAGIVVLQSPAHAAAFWNRFWLGTERYPTRTQIVELSINGAPISVFHADVLRVAIPQDNPFRIEVTVAGDQPATVEADVRGLQSRDRTQWQFTTVDDTAVQFAFQVPRLVESIRFHVRAGDAISDPVEVAIVPLPVVDVVWSARPPAYAAGLQQELTAGARQFAALQGSQLALRVSGVNKQLQAAILKIGTKSIPLVKSTNPGGDVWQLPAESPLQELREAVTYELDVVDVDQLRPQPALSGEIRLQPDRPPRVAAAVISRRLLPAAAPKVTYGATDDFGLRAVRWELEIVRTDGSRQSATGDIWRRKSPTSERTLRGETTIPLSSYGLTKGDEVRVTLLAEDERGDYPTGTGRSDTLVFDITDRNGILESLLEFDQQSARQLDEIIERELGIGRISK